MAPDTPATERAPAIASPKEVAPETAPAKETPPQRATPKEPKPVTPPDAGLSPQPYVFSRVPVAPPGALDVQGPSPTHRQEFPHGLMGRRRRRPTQGVHSGTTPKEPPLAPPVPYGLTGCQDPPSARAARDKIFADSNHAQPQVNLHPLARDVLEIIIHARAARENFLQVISAPSHVSLIRAQRGIF